MTDRSALPPASARGPFRALPFWTQGIVVAVQFFVPVTFAVALALLGIALRAT